MPTGVKWLMGLVEYGRHSDDHPICLQSVRKPLPKPFFLSDILGISALKDLLIC